MSDHGEVRILDSGIALPPRDVPGPPVVVLQTAVPQLQINILLDHVEHPDQVEQLSADIAHAQLALRDGHKRRLRFVEPQYGTVCYLTPAGIESVLAVSPGFAQFVDAEASQKLGKLVKRDVADIGERESFKVLQ